MKKKLQNWREFTILIILEGRESLHLDSIPSRDVFFSDLGLEGKGGRRPITTTPPCTDLSGRPRSVQMGRCAHESKPSWVVD